MGDVVVLDMATTLDIPPDRVLDGAKDSLDSVVLVGWDKDGDLYLATSSAKTGEILLLLEMAKKKVMESVS